jgi:hypothetical protein
MKEVPQNVSESVRKRNPHLYSVILEDGSVGTTTVNPTPKRIRQDTKPLLNKLELEYWGVLKRIYTEGPDRIICQAIRFQLANGLWYKPDFVVFTYAGPDCYEVKGPHAFRGGFENLKMAARLYPFLKWKLAWKENGIWKEQVVLP